MRRRAVVAVVGVLLIVASCSQSKPTTAGQPGASSGRGATPTTAAPTTVRFVATGDMLPHDAILQEGTKPDGSYDFNGMLTQVKPYFERADVRFCNEATPAGGPQFGITGYPVFNAPLEWSRALEGAGCNLVNLGTNHTNDKGQPLIDAFVAGWDARPGVLAVAGANRTAEEQKAIRYFETNTVKFAFLSYITYNNKPNGTAYGVNTYTDAVAKAQIAEARQNADVVVVSMRWGTEDSATVNPTQQRLAQQLADDGADIVLGHGPHVLQPVDRLIGTGGRETIVWNSLGNFLNAQLPIESLIGGFATMDIDIAKRKVTSIGFLPVYSHYEWTAAQKAARDLLARHSFAVYPLDKAADALARSQNGTTIDAQMVRVREVLNRNTAVPLLTSDEYFSR
jgi:poly-gamma-glutamate synthesis protein (capsule biosynthesis protein)